MLVHVLGTNKQIGGYMASYNPLTEKEQTCGWEVMSNSFPQYWVYGAF